MSDQPKDFDAIYPASRARPLTPEEKLAIEAQKAEAERQAAMLRETYPASQARVTGKAKTFGELYPRSVTPGLMDDGDLPPDDAA